MDTYPFFRRIAFPLIVLIAVSFSLSRCTPGVIPEDLSLLTQKQDSILSEMDSLQQLLYTRSLQYDTVSANYNLLIEELERVNNQNKSLRSGYNARGQQVKKVKAENTAITQKATILDKENDSLRIALNLVQQQLAKVENDKALADSINSDLTEFLQEKDDKLLADSLNYASDTLSSIETGFVSINEIGGGIGLGNIAVDYSKNLISFNSVAAYRINKNFLTGVGSGVHFYNGGAMIPLYIDFRYSFGKGKINPFIVADGGLLFVLKDFSSSGTFINPAIGASRKLSEKTSLSLSAGLLMQASPAGPSSGGYRRSFINIKGAISFKGK
jgi:hypothetical protein